jgi:hypothetical protein
MRKALTPFKARKPGTIPAGKLGVYDEHGRLRGHVGPRATAATVSRFTNRSNAKLGKDKSGKPCWMCEGR